MDQSFKKKLDEDHKIDKFEKVFDEKQASVRADLRETLAYRELNTRYLSLEERAVDEEDWKDKKKTYETRKKAIEAHWVSRTIMNATSIFASAGKVDWKDGESYIGFTLSQMEILLKNNERGGNSEEYNNVVTDLELYNAVFDSTKVSDEERMALLQRLSDSCDYYVSKRHPITPKGKIRKAMIESLGAKVDGEIQKLLKAGVQLQSEDQDTVTTSSVQAQTVQTEKIDKSKLMKLAKDAYAKFHKTPSVPLANAACKANFDVITLILQKKITASDSERKTLDKQMEEIFPYVCKAPRELSIDPDQNDTATTRFLNAIGWSDRRPDVTDEAGFAQAVSKAPIKRRMFHTINCLGGQQSAALQAKQLLGKGDGPCRHYQSNGVYGKGTYLAAANKNAAQDYDATVSRACWSYGIEAGSLQMDVCLNEHAKVILVADVLRYFKELETLFPELHGWIESVDLSRPGENYAFITALYGYNVVLSPFAGSGQIDYLSVCDRSALTISSVATMRTAKSDFNGLVRVNLLR